MTNKDTNRNALAALLNTASYESGTTKLRDLLRRHLLAVLGQDWEKIHNEYGMYTINCRRKSSRRILEKFDKLRVRGESIDVENFYRFMPDLVAGRLVVVDPGKLFDLAERVRKGCVPPLFEPPDPPHVNYRVRHGKFSMYDTARFTDADYKVETEETGYCSVHFVYRTGKEFFEKECYEDDRKHLRDLSKNENIPLDAWHVEIQVRTIMDEAWGETDHFVRYENSDLREDPELKSQFAVLAAYLQAANYHVSLIRDTVQRKGKGIEES